MTKFAEMVEALKTSITEQVAAGRPDLNDQLAKSIDQFGDAVGALIEKETALRKEAPPRDPAALLGHAVLGVADAVRAVEAGEVVLMKGGSLPSEGAMELLKAAVDLSHCAVQLIAAEQATPIADEREAEAGLGLMKMEVPDGELLVKHALSTEGMAFLADPESVAQEAVEAALHALQGLGVDVQPLMKAAEEDPEDPENPEDEDPENPDAMGEGDNPLTSLAQLGLAAITTTAALREAAEAEGATPEELAELDRIAQHGAFITVQADKLLNAAGDQGEGGEGEMEGADKEAEMALAAHIDGLAKQARAYILSTTPKEELIKAAGGELQKQEAPKAPDAPTLQKQAPAAPAAKPPALMAVGKGEDGQPGAQTIEEEAQRLAKMATTNPEAVTTELIKAAMRNPVVIT